MMLAKPKSATNVSPRGSAASRATVFCSSMFDVFDRREPPGENRRRKPPGEKKPPEETGGRNRRRCLGTGL
eukprot:1027875-Prorocentrum_minimum.AAC.2